MGIRSRLGAFLRKHADRIDPDHAPYCMSPYSFTFELNEGIRWRDDGRGCPLWYLGGAEHDRAFTESDSRPPWIDWTTMTVRQYPDSRLTPRAGD